jgi:hypothetical protein
MKLLFAAVHESLVGPTRTFCGIIAYVGCLRTSGLVVLAASSSESDPEQTLSGVGSSEALNEELTALGMRCTA